MNIKQIIREEMDGFQWIRDIDPHEELYEPWVRRAIELMEDTIYYFDTDIGRQLGLLKRHTRSKKIIEDAIRVIFRRVTMERIGEPKVLPSHSHKTREEYEEDKKFLEGYELLKKSIQPKIYKRALKNLNEQDDFEWVREMEPYNIHQGPWIIIYDGDEEFVEVQEWLFTQGYEWVNVEQPTTVMMPQYPNDYTGFLFSGWVDPDYPHSNELFDGYGGKRGMDMLDRIKASGDRVIYKWSKDIKPYIGV